MSQSQLCSSKGRNNGDIYSCNFSKLVKDIDSRLAAVKGNCIKNMKEKKERMEHTTRASLLGSAWCHCYSQHPRSTVGAELWVGQDKWWKKSIEHEQRPGLLQNKTLFPIMGPSFLCFFISHHEHTKTPYLWSLNNTTHKKHLQIAKHNGKATQSLTMLSEWK